MSDWHAGYTAETNYTYGYYTELNPLRAQLLLLSAGIKPPATRTACELGFGQGITVNIHAAASNTQWYGNDFNPAQTAFAQEAADVAGSGAVLSEQSFEHFCARADLPDFDYIGLHGIWSWISPDNQHVIVDFLARKLKPGGVLYISYNTQAGWAAMAPIRDLLDLHGRVMSAPGQDIRSRVGNAMAFVKHMLALKPRYLLANPNITQRVEQFGAMDPNYLAHEFFNAYWQPVAFSALAPVLGAAKLEFAAPVAYSEHVHALNVTPEHMEFLAAIPDLAFRETTRDFLVNQQFRQDYWVKGARRIGGYEQALALRQLRIMLVAPRELVTMKVAGALGEAAMDEAVYGAVLDLLAGHRAHSIGELEQRLQGVVADLGALLQVIMVLAHKACISLVQDDDAIALARPKTDRLNRHLLQMAPGRTDLMALASPVTGGGIIVTHMQQLFLLEASQGRVDPDGWAQAASVAMLRLNQMMTKDGVTALEGDERMSELLVHARHFAGTILPVLQLLGVIPAPSAD